MNNTNKEILTFNDLIKSDILFKEFIKQYDLIKNTNMDNYTFKYKKYELELNITFCKYLIEYINKTRSNLKLKTFYSKYDKVL